MRSRTWIVCVLGLSLRAQCEGIAPPDPGEWRGPGDIVVPLPQPTARRAVAAPVGPPASAPAPAVPRATHLRLVPPVIAQALARYGAPVELVHQRTALARLTYAWESVKVLQPPPEGITVARPKARALPLAEAASRVADGDHRPQLVLRECWQCGSGAESDIGRKLANEKTVLLAKWFRCVRVSDAVRHPDHPLHAMFAAPASPHLVLCAPDGKALVGFTGREPLSALWSAMGKLLRQHVAEDFDAAVREELAILSQFDHLDTMEDGLATRLDVALEEGPAGRAEVAGLRRRLAELAVERSALLERERVVLGSAAPAR